MTAAIIVLSGVLAVLCGGMSVFLWMHGGIWSAALNAFACLWNVSSFVRFTWRARRGGAQ